MTDAENQFGRATPHMEGEYFDTPVDEFREPWLVDMERDAQYVPDGHDLSWEGVDEEGKRHKLRMRLVEYMGEHGKTTKAVEYGAGVAAVALFVKMGVRHYKNGHLGPKARG
jgi:hypothetical protein